VDRAKLERSYQDLIEEACKAQETNTRIGFLAVVEKLKEAVAVADLIGGAGGAYFRSDADQLRSNTLFRLGDLTMAARAACSSLGAARAAGSRTVLVRALIMCATVARDAPGEMASAERESRERERPIVSPSYGGLVSPSYGGLDLSQEGRVSLPTTLAALSRLALAYNEAAVAICDAAVAAAGGRDTPAAADSRRVPLMRTEAIARASLSSTLRSLHEQRQRSLELTRQAVALLQQAVRMAAPGKATSNAERGLANELSNMADVLREHGADGMVEAEACLREALALGEGTGNVCLTLKTLQRLINLCGAVHGTVGPAEAEAFRSRLNQCLVQMGRSPETSCSICLEPLAPPADGAVEDALPVAVLRCDHQFHRSCIIRWLHSTQSAAACPLCKN